MLLCLVAAGLPARAAETVEGETAQGSRFEIHGFLSQAFATSDGETVVGIPDSGTTDYRTAALQLRYRMSERGSWALQLAHERLGDSPRASMREDVELDWVFYRHRLGDYTEVKVGRVPIPRGIYNEILDVGTALPFYRPPLNVYGESAFASETVDGAVLSHSLFAGDWLLEGDLYYGGWQFTEFSGGQFGEGKAEDAVGLQVWAKPPVSGLRVGLAGQTFLLRDGVLRPPGEKERWDVWTGSFEWAFRRVTLRSETVSSRGSGAEYRGYYGMLGIRLASPLTLNLLAERADLEVEALGLDMRYDESFGVGLSYAFSSDVVAKLEVHRTEGYFHVEVPAANIFGPPTETTYGILSLATSF